MMRKLLLFLLIPIMMLAQAPTNFPYGIKNAAAVENTIPTYIVTQELDGIHKKTPASLLIKPTPTLQEVTGAGATTTVPISIDSSQNSGSVGIDVIGGDVGVKAVGGDIGLEAEGGNEGLRASSLLGKASVFFIGNANSNNISEFVKGTELKAAITHDGRIIHSPAVNANEGVTKGQLDTAISGTVNTIPKFSASNTLTDSSWKEDSGRLFNGVDDLVNGFQLTGADAIINGVSIGKGKNTAATTNIVFGQRALNSVTIGISNTALGARALYNTTAGNSNTGVGRSALDSNTIGIANSSVGANSLAYNTIGDYNVGVGSFAGYWQAEGDKNTFIGNEAGLNTSTGGANTLAHNSVFIGSNSKSLGVGGANEIVIGYNASGLGSNTAVIGNDATVTTALRGNGLFGTLVDNGIDRLQVNGTISANPAVNANQVVVKSQLDSAISSVPTPTLQSVTQSGATTTVPISVSTNVADGRAINAFSNTGFGSYNSSNLGSGSYNASNSGFGSYNASNSGIASVHETRNSNNTNNISEFKKLNVLQAAITHDGRIIHSPAVNANEGVTLGQIQSLIATPAITTVLVNNTGASLGALNANTTVNLNLNTSSIWATSTTASKTGATVAEIIDPTTGKIKDVADKNLNTFRVVLEVSHAGGGSDGTLELALVNPSGSVVDQEGESINIDGLPTTNKRLSFRFFVVKTADNNEGYTLRINNGARSLTAYRVVSILRNNNP